ncbi:hypothetical protein L2E82_22516 [Cichorium intybus]|uniref:Uncharacterized protein n=1 Tax=Cichorium intybus TaxID=13427 RepID=A0ACB9DY93_CICIN|nr:hypothetical protein L2E82_22516 [Cichorium intybus]
MSLSMEKPNPFAAQRSDEEDEDTMSLSDFSLYCDQNVESWVEEPSMSDDDEQGFEFSSEMLINSHDSSNPIVFCGKYVHISHENIQKFESKMQRSMHPRMNVERKVSILASKRKSRWYVFMFGFGSRRFPTEMHIKDLRKRQTYVPPKCNYTISFDECDRHGMGKSRGLMRFLGCVGGSNHNNNNGDVTHPPNTINVKAG